MPYYAMVVVVEAAGTSTASDVDQSHGFAGELQFVGDPWEVRGGLDDIDTKSCLADLSAQIRAELERREGPVAHHPV
jgi:hypothetical protein